ncbi:hypothetical protein UO65_6630 [Actinokineospora spheciospongiae]|uniref:Uncharacterized protein n=1 Tax=Actinokineospora spheciospongiae TaxID=909613 RepID=W7IVP8_9PSEU|nr:hypothetical protein [Actinokineospora spheciospongiae]EWC58074.1 hypothetical protein UO65_6630 [Actinokineospora spheciospongiae]
MSRWPLLYARSRRIPAAVVAAVLGTVGVGLLAGDAGDPRLAALATALGAAALATSLGSADPALDRTAAFAWPPRRAAHLLLGAALLAGLLLLAAPLAPEGVLLRDVAGLTGLGALGATAFGADAAWSLPVAWAALTLVVPPAGGGIGSVLTWPVQPAACTAASATAITLGCTGLLVHTALGCRR